MREFLWWRVSQYGTAEAFPDTPAIRKRVDTERGWYGSVEGTIFHGGVIATAFNRKIEATYDAAIWLRTGECVPCGSVTITEITAEPKMRSGDRRRSFQVHT